MPTIIVSGVPRETKISTIPLDSIRLDPSNVRFDHLPHPLTEKEIQEFIWEEEDTRSLMQSIIAAKGLQNRPVVMPNGSGSYLVKEGNRRIVALRKIVEAIKAKQKFAEGFPKEYLNNIECEVLPSDMPEDEVDIYLAREHVTGKRDWAALNQASHFYSLYEDHKMPYERITSLLEVSKATVVRRIKAFKASKEYLKKYPDDKLGIRCYTYFDEFYKKRSLNEALQMDPGLLEKFIDWLGNGKFRDHRQVRKLPDALDNTKAMSVLESENMDAAIRAIESSTPPQLKEPLYSTVQSTIEHLQKMPRVEISKIREDTAKMDLIKELKKEVDKVIEEVGQAS